MCFVATIVAQTGAGCSFNTWRRLRSTLVLTILSMNVEAGETQFWASASTRPTRTI